MINVLKKVFLTAAALALVSACSPVVPATSVPTQMTPNVTSAPTESAVLENTAAPVSASTEASVPQPGETAELTVMTHDSFAVSEDVIKKFEQENNVKLNLVKSGDAGSAINKAILSKDNPQADVFYGVDNTFLSRALTADIFDVYASPLLKTIPVNYDLDASHHLLPVDYGDVCINFDKAYFSEKGLKVPATLDDLTRPEYKGLLAVENPATSSPGLAFMLATVAQYGPDKFLDYWKQLKDNDVVVTDGWETAYYTQFSGSSGRGPQPMVVSYGTSPAAEVVFAETPIDTAPTASIVGDNTCFRQIEFVGILKGSQKRALAEKWVDFMLGKSFQEDIPLQIFVFPVNQEAVLPDVFTKNIQMPKKPAGLSPDQIEANRDAWIEGWRGVMLK